MRRLPAPVVWRAQVSVRLRCSSASVAQAEGSSTGGGTGLGAGLAAGFGALAARLGDGGGCVDDAGAAGLSVALGHGGGRVLQDADDLRGLQIGVGGQHQRDGPGDVGSRLTGAYHEGVSGGLWGCRRLVGRGQDLGAGLAGLSTGGGDLDGVTVVREGRAGPGARGGTDGDDVLAAGRIDVTGVLITVAGGGDDDGAACDSGIDCLLQEACARARAAQAHIDDLGTVLVDRYAVDLATGGPGDGVDEVGAVGAAAAQEADGHDLGVRGDTRDTIAVVRVRGDGAGYMGTVPGRLLTLVPVLAASVIGGALTRFGPVSLVRGIVVVAVVVTGALGVGDEVVARQELALEVRVVGQDAGVDDGDRDALAGGLRPGVGGIDSVGARGHVPLLGEVGVVGDIAVLGGGVAQGSDVNIGLDGLDAVGGLERGDELLDLIHGELVTELHGRCAHGVSGHALQLDRELSRGGGQCLLVLGRQGAEDVLTVCLRRSDDLARRRVLGVRDDEAVTGLGDLRRVAVGRGRCRGGGLVSAEDSGANQADGDETDCRDGGDDDEQDAFSAEGHGGEAFGRDVSGPGSAQEPGMRRFWHETAEKSHR